MLLHSKGVLKEATGTGKDKVGHQRTKDDSVDFVSFATDAVLIRNATLALVERLKAGA